MTTPSREVPVDPARAALLIIDVQNYCAGAKPEQTDYLLQSLRDAVLPNIRQLQFACRRAGVEVAYSVIENMTATAAIEASTTRSPASTWRGVPGTRGSSMRSRRPRMK